MSQSHFSFFAEHKDLREHLAKHFLDAEDVAALAGTDRRLRTLFSENSIWSSLLNRDLGLAVETTTPLKQIYGEIIAERKRLITYAQLFLNPLYATDDPNSVDNHHANLRCLLMVGDYKKFIAGAKFLLRESDQTKIAEYAETLTTFYNAIFLTSFETSTNHVVDILDNRESNLVNVIYSDAKKIDLLISLLVKCGAIRSLELLFYNLRSHQAAPHEESLLNRFINHFGSTMLCDSVTYHHPHITDLLLMHGVPVNTPSKLNEYSESAHLYPLECAIKALHLYYQNYKNHQTFFLNTGALEKIGMCIQALCAAGADADINVAAMTPRRAPARKNLFGGVPHRPQTQTMRDYAAEAAKEINADPTLGQREKSTMCHILQLVISSNIQPAPVPMVIGDDDDFSDSSSNEADQSSAEPSPKKARSVENTPTKESGIDRWLSRKM